MGSRARIGWVISDQLERVPWVRESALTGGGVGLARYSWLSRHVNRQKDADVQYEVYRPWRRYDAVVFLKSMGTRALDLLQRLQRRRTPCIFDVNVNYFETGGTEYYRGMLPTEEQKQQVSAMARAATAVIADSEFIASRCRLYNRHTAWIPDNVPMEEVPAYRPTPAGKRLRLLWSGEAVKLFELLAAEDALLALRDRLELVLVTGDLAATSRLYPEVRDRLERLLSSLSVDVVRFESIARLFEIYAAGGVCISPRFLDNPYNFGHTEWKISLAMACGRIAVCSPVPSYVAVAERAQDRGIRICDSHEEWLTAFDELLGGHCRWDEEESAARTVVDRFYSTRAVAANHMAFVRGVLDENAAGQGARLKAG